jgi:adenine-specific DNA-methyltransferase
LRYLGSKVSTTNQLFELLSERIGSGHICDPFGGVGTIGAAFKQRGYHVWSGDILTNAHYFQVAKLVRKKASSFKKVRAKYQINTVHSLLEIINSSSDCNGWFVNEYSVKRQFFTRGNAERIAGSLKLFEEWDKEGLLSYTEKAVLLASVVNSMDKVANTAGTYYAYLKSWYRKSLKEFCFNLIDVVEGPGECKAFKCDVKEIVSKRHFDILYLDPPYNQRNYAGYYHLPETIALMDQPETKGKAGIPERVDPKSKFNRKADALNELKEILSLASFDLLAFHYTDDGLIAREDLCELFGSIGKVDEYVLDAKGYSTLIGSARSVKQRLYLVKNE